MKALWQSTENFFKRFGVEPTLNEQHRVFLEETKEFKHALFIGTTGDHDAAHELADVLVTAMKLLMLSGYTLEEFEQAIADVAAKNDAKTFETHYIRESDGKIARRGK